MKIKLITMAALLAALMLTTAHAAIEFYGKLGALTTATDIILWKCSPQPSITVAHAAVRDDVPIVATPPNIRIQVAKATSATTCPASGDVGWTAAQTTSGEGTWSPFTANISVSQTPPNNYYCIKVTKATASTNADDYRVIHRCGINPTYPGPIVNFQSTFHRYTQDQ